MAAENSKGGIPLIQVDHMKKYYPIKGGIITHITGQVKARRGGTTPHGWTEVKMGDTWYIFDTELQDALGGNYYKKTYANYPTKPLIKEAEWEVYF